MNEQQVEQQIKEKGLTAPRITSEHIDSVIVDKMFIQPANTTMTICILQLRNGMCVVGESSCVSAANFDFQIGEDLAYSNARDKVWTLEGYLLRQQIYQAEALTTQLDYIIKQ